MGNCCYSHPPVNSRIRDPYHTEELRSQQFTELRKFTFDGLVTKAKVVDVYDGDTVTIVFYYNHQPIKDSFRMLGYDSPELKPLKTTPNRELHITAGEIVKKYLQQLILDQLVWVRFCREEKYGRLMGELYLIQSSHPDQLLDTDESLNHHMIARRFGKPYHGEHKEAFTEKELHTIIGGQ